MSSWIKMRTNLATDPRVGAIADDCGVTEASVLGAIFFLLAMAEEHSKDGLLKFIRPESIDRRVGVPGFCIALERVGWLIVGDSYLEVPHFGQWKLNSHFCESRVTLNPIPKGQDQ